MYYIRWSVHENKILINLDIIFALPFFWKSHITANNTI